MGNYTYGKGSDKKMSVQDKDKEKMLPKIIAIDFDGTLVKNKFPEIGEINPHVWGAALRAKAEGIRIILWTSRTGGVLDKAVQFCTNHGLTFDAINDNIPEVKALGWNARKVFATLYIDDRSGTIDFDGAFAQLTHDLF